MPALIVVAPVYVLTPESVSVLVPDLVKAPVPLIMPDSVWAAVEPYWNVPALLIAPAYVPLPRLPAPPIESVPALIVVAPVYVFAPERVWVPDDNVNPPVPDITPE